MKTKILFISLCLATFVMAQTADNDTTSMDSRQPDYAWIYDGSSVYIPYSNANVGIRTDMPQEALHVNGYICGDGGHRALRVRTECGTTTIGADSWAYSHFNTDRPRFYFYKPIMVQDGCISSSSQTNLQLQTFNYNGSSLYPITRMTILYSNGNVGIGTTTPIEKLDVNGKMYLRTIDVDPVTNWNRSYLYWASHNLIMGTPPGEPSHNSLDLKPGGTTSIPDPLFSRLRMYTATSTNVQTQKVELCTESDCWFLNEGNFGIGTSSPTHKLDVRGTVRANEILVNIPSGADFVFEENYQLMPLESLSEYVRQNKHLPEVKSAEEMEQEGVTMGEMQIKLLQKIEELTLYVIQQEKRIKELETKANK